jgi:hypothetical protein
VGPEEDGRSGAAAGGACGGEAEDARPDVDVDLPDVAPGGGWRNGRADGAWRKGRADGAEGVWREGRTGGVSGGAGADAAATGRSGTGGGETGRGSDRLGGAESGGSSVPRKFSGEGGTGMSGRAGAASLGFFFFLSFGVTSRSRKVCLTGMSSILGMTTWIGPSGASVSGTDALATAASNAAEPGVAALEPGRTTPVPGRTTSEPDGDEPEAGVELPSSSSRPPGELVSGCVPELTAGTSFASATDPCATLTVEPAS